MKTLEEIELAAMQLTEAERIELADALYSSLPVDTEVEQAWTEEIERRITEIEEGKVKAIPLEEVLRQGRKIIDESRSFSTVRKG